MNRILLGRIDVIALAVVPLVYLVIDPSFGQNQIGDIDTWFYFGLAKSFWHQLGPDFPNDYYETRLPYIIPAAVIFVVPYEKTAAFILSYLVYCCSAFSLFYVLRRHTSKPAALLATILMTNDVFFVRAVGWQYVDGGVLAYGSMSFAALAAARTSRHKYGFVVLSGFLCASMLVVHLGSAPFVLALLGYAVFIFDLRRMTRKEFFTLFLCATLGIVICQAVYGLLNIYLYGTEFLFEAQQVIAGIITQRNAATWQEAGLSLPLASGWWLAVHIGVWFAAAVMLLAKATRFANLTAFQTYCMWAVLGTYSILFVSDYSGISTFLARGGLYVTPYLFLSYLFIGSVLPPTIGTAAALICGSLFLVSLAVRLRLNAEFADGLHALSAWEVGIALGWLIAAVALGRTKVLGVLVAPAAAALLLATTWRFFDQREVYAARESVASAVGDTLPYFAYSQKDPVALPFTIGLVGSFSPRAWWMSCNTFPDCALRSIGHTTMIIVTSDSESAEVSRLVASEMPEITARGTALIYRSKDEFSVYRVDIGSLPILIPAAKLFSIVGTVAGSARVASEGTVPGYLTYGPYAHLDPGHYQITIKFQAEGDAGHWDVVAGKDAITVANGPVPDSHGKTDDIVVPLDFPKGAEALQVRTVYAGHGRLSVLSLGILPLNRKPAVK